MKMSIIYDLKEGSKCTRVIYLSDFVTHSVSRTLSKSMNRPPQPSILRYVRFLELSEQESLCASSSGVVRNSIISYLHQQPNHVSCGSLSKRGNILSDCTSGNGKEVSIESFVYCFISMNRIC